MADRITFKPGTVTEQIVRFGGVELPPIVSGIELTTDFQGNPKEVSTRVIGVTRTQIEALLNGVQRECPELNQVLSIVQAFMLQMDGIRDHAKLGALIADGWLAEDVPNVPASRENLQKVATILGRREHEHLLYLS
ncbi:hypothetical protein D3C87_782680 [compost metagenome]